MKKEIRSNSSDVIVDGRLIYGCAIKFNSESQDIGWIETISPEAVTDDLIKNSDVFALLNHNENDVLARCRYGEGSLKLELKSDGLYYEFEAPHTIKGDELIEHIKRGEIWASSFGFTVTSDEWSQDLDGTLHRKITKIDRLYDVSPVYEPAYLSTSCNKREMVDKLNKELNSKLADIYLYKI